MLLLWLRQLPWCGDVTSVSVLPPTEGRSSPTNTPVFPPSSFILPSFAWFYTFFSAGQVVLSTLSWCSGCTSASEVYSWCILGDRCTPRSPTPPPSCSICIYFLVLLNYLGSPVQCWKGVVKGETRVLNLVVVTKLWAHHEVWINGSFFVDILY